MLETILKLYVMAMAGDVRSPLPHLVGPPGCGKSTVIEQAAELLGVNLHTVNVSRISPLELEGVQMPVDMNTRLEMLTATLWTSLKDGDIVFFDEFLRGFPEVYNGLLDIFTARRVGSFQLPKVFIIAASNTTVAYDKALEDRILHIPAADPRNDSKEFIRLRKLFLDKIGGLPSFFNSLDLTDLFNHEVLPMFNMLDMFNNKANSSTVSIEGHSIRHLIGQVQLRHVTIPDLKSVINEQNRQALAEGKPQYVILLSGQYTDTRYIAALPNLLKLRDKGKLTPIQVMNLELNLQLIQLAEAKTKEMEEEENE